MQRVRHWGYQYGTRIQTRIRVAACRIAGLALRGVRITTPMRTVDRTQLVDSFADSRWLVPATHVGLRRLQSALEWATTMAAVVRTSVKVKVTATRTTIVPAVSHVARTIVRGVAEMIVVRQFRIHVPVLTLRARRTNALELNLIHTSEAQSATASA